MSESISITDNRTGDSIEIPIHKNGVDSAEWSKLLPGIWFDDASFGNTSGAHSAVTELDGNAGFLRYRGYPIENLVRNALFLKSPISC